MISRAAFPVLALVLAVATVSGQQPQNPAAAALRNPVARTPEAVAAGKRAYDTYCASCHGNSAQGADRAGVAISL